MKNQINELQNFIDKQKGSLKIKVRKQAISRAKSALILNGKKAEDISDEDWEHLVADEKIKFGSNIRQEALLLYCSFWNSMVLNADILFCKR